MSALFTGVLVLAPLVLIGIVVFSLTRRGKAEQPGWRPASREAPRPQTSPAAGSPLGPSTRSSGGPLTDGHGVWNAQVMGGGLIGLLGGTLNSTFGRFVLAEGALSFLPDGSREPAWTVPCRELFFTHNGVLSPAAVELRGPMGTVRCDVSLEHINRFTRNSAKSFREARQAQAFVQALVAHGARGA
ncbi:hypothetical protein ASG90_20435 [Nocardioides sp. Soil797]|nr:hypothetical protein ASG90_20435 [Nocardioides sp. Soil797]